MHQDDTPLNSRDRLLIFLSLLIVIVTPFAADSYTPSLPIMTSALNSSTDPMQLTMSFYLFGAATSQLFYGPLADMHGRKPVILLGLVITVIGSLLCAAANSLAWILIARWIQGTGAGVCNALFRAVIRDSFTGTKMSIAGSYAGMFFSLAYAIAPMVGGYVEYYLGWRANFIVTFMLIFVIIILLWSLLPETNLNKNPNLKLSTVLHNYYKLMTSPVFVGYTVISSLALSGMIAYYTAAPFILQNVVGLTSIEFGLMSIALASGIFIGQYVNAKLVASIGVTKMLFAGIVVKLLSALAMLVLALMGFINVYVIVIPVTFFCIGAGLVFSNAMANAFHAFSHMAGVAGSVYGFIQIFGTTVTSLFVVYLHERNQIPLACVFTGLGICAISLFYYLQRVTR